MMVGVFGRQGGGKSTLGAMLARMIAARLGAAVYTNMNIPGAVRITKLSQIPLDRRPKVLLLDEAMFSLDSRQSASKKQLDWTKFIAYIRKLHCCLIYMTHYPMMVEQRLREQTNFAFFCLNRGDRFQWHVVDVQSMQVGCLEAKKDPAMFAWANFDTEDFPSLVEADALDYDALRPSAV